MLDEEPAGTPGSPAKYEQALREGDRERVLRYRPKRAIVAYEAALTIGGNRDRYAQQMMGVCYTMLHEYDDATTWLIQALEGASNYERGNIERDLAAAYLGLGELGLANISLQTSLHYFAPPKQLPSEYGASLGFTARLRLKQGKIKEALGLFTDADQWLRQGSNRQVELYHKLHYAVAMSRYGHDRQGARILANQALDLAKQHGAPVHRWRARAILLGGWPTEAVFSWCLARWNFWRARRP